MKTKEAIFAGGCFWCIEHDFRALHGVTSIVSGYSGGEKVNPTYMDVVTHNAPGHRESILVTYNEHKTNFKKLVQFFLDHIDPTDCEGQFYDRGESYAPAIFVSDDEEKSIAEDLIREADASHVYDKPVKVAIIPVKPFYPAEEHHQEYASKNPEHYASYRRGSGREDFVNNVCQIRDSKIPWKD